MYPDELLEYDKLIEARRLADWKMKLAIAQNPHAEDPKKLWEALNRQEDDDNYLEAELDKEAMAAFKEQLSGNSRIIVK